MSVSDSMKGEKMIKLRNGRMISNVLISTALGISGCGIFLRKWNLSYLRLIRTVRDTSTTVVAKSFTLPKYDGNFHPWRPWTWRNIQTLPDGGMLNAYKLTNPGMLESEREISKSREMGFDVIPSYGPRFDKERNAILQETLLAIKYLHLERSYDTVELELSCPNLESDIRRMCPDTIWLIKKLRLCFPQLVIIAKVNYEHPFEFVQELEQIGVDVVHAINAIPFHIVYPGKPSPLAKVGGGAVSGGPARGKAMKYIGELRKRIKGPMIAGCGICSIEDAKAYCDLIRPDDSISICTVALRRPKEAIRILELYNR